MEKMVVVNRGDRVRVRYRYKKPAGVCNVAARLFVLVILVALTSCTSTGTLEQHPEMQSETPVSPDREEMQRRMARAVTFLSWNLQDQLYQTPVLPVWLSDRVFWYRVRTPEGVRFRYVDPAEGGEIRPAFDHRELVAAITRKAGSPPPDGEVPFRTFRYSRDGENISFLYRGEYWTCNRQSWECEDPIERVTPPENSIPSPNRRNYVVRNGPNLSIWNRETRQTVDITHDGEERYAYALDSQGWRKSDRPVVRWSPDSRRVATYRLNEREVGELPVVKMTDGRPEVESRPYAMPGDSVLPKLEPVILDLDRQEVISVRRDPGWMRASNCCGLIRNDAWVDTQWSRDSSTLYRVEVSRDYRTATLVQIDASSGEAQVRFVESLDPYIESNLKARSEPNWRVDHERRELVWFSRNDGWGHLYLYDLDTGKQKSRLTSGEWNVIDLLSWNREEGTLIFTAMGREEGVDPYFELLYRLNLRTGDLNRLTPSDDHHQVSLSPDESIAVVNRSRPDQYPVSEYIDMNSGEIVPLEETWTGGLEAVGFSPPRPFQVKARDGETDLHGLLFFPADFDSTQSYPVIVSIYPGPQTGSVGARSFSAYRRGQAHAMAQLGFVVMQLDALGTPFRSARFHTWWHGNLSDNGLQDQVGALRQLGERHSWLDLDRVGIYGHSGGGYATVAAMLRYPDVFHVGVAGAGNLDNALYTDYWGEKYQGIPRESALAYRNQEIHRQAHRLKGKLLLTYGTADLNVHPVMSWQLMNRLMEQGRRFDLMVFPDRDHSYANEPYNLQLTWDYFARHLLGRGVMDP